MKTCKRCHRDLPYSEFYVHKEMSDGYLSFCKECTLRRVKEHRLNNLGKIQEYDRNRPNKAERSEKSTARAIDVRNTPSGMKKYKARIKFGYAIRSGQVIRPEKCSRCGTSGHIEGHHHDYSKPLDIEWLCRACHGIKHRK